MSTKDNTVNTYKRSLLKLKKMGIDLNNYEINDLIELFNKNNIPLTSQNAYLSSIQWYHKNYDKDEIKMSKVSGKIREIREIISFKYSQNKLSNKEKDKYVQFETIKKIFNDLKEKAENSLDKRINDDFLLLSLYVLHPPRRTDYQNMYIEKINITDDIDKVIWTNKDTVSKNKLLLKQKEKHIDKNRIIKNYYTQIGDKSYFIFDDFKTYNIYGRQIIEVNNVLDKIIKRYIDINKLKNGNKLIDLSYENYLKRLSDIFMTYVEKNISIDMLRHIYVNYITDMKLNENNKKIISKLMAHSILTQTIYRKNINDDIANIEIDLGKYTEKKSYRKYASDDERKEARKEAKRLWYEKNKEKIAKKNATK
ncbi:hypothetical protein QKU48_gp1428 [Fadolivirus algeromassiliense]|jgi:hypothetical protein|uniref:Uncharacterized protein n=1 Tax=Fadolivirus FV1/VV64 TaxID=3070911 RepID=A0A7D3QWZ3_9VIRU|nr:hypothetical protein QKU48_gp1428 [Fadolivirus algeromassiliense]QKF94886.1 hypothetical protein Fadolivirus_1_1428 [Fadolivirus FV1/VV64]